MKRKAVKIIACATVLKEMRPILPPGVQCIKMEPGLHLHRDRLRRTLQDIIDDVSHETEKIILGYGLCSMAAMGLKASGSTLIIPRVDDCIAIFLGSQKLYRHHLHKKPGTYFLSKGWIDAGVTIIQELKQAEELLGKRVAEMLRERMLRQYAWLSYIDMGWDDKNYYREFSMRTAEKLNLEYKEIKGTTSLMERMIKGPWNEEFIVAPPGRVISLEDFKINRVGAS